MAVYLVPVGPRHKPDVVGEDHTAVEHVDHHPLVDSPDQGTSPASLRENHTTLLKKTYISIYKKVL